MLSRSFDTSVNNEVGYLHDVPEREHATGVVGLQDDVERLIDIAAELFSAIERQIHRIEEELAFAGGEEVRAYAQTVFKERLIRCAQSLEVSIHDIGVHVERRANEHIVNFGLRDASQA
jgi:hypothetical protein